MDKAPGFPVPALGDLERVAAHAVIVGDDRVAIAICDRLAEYEGGGCVLLGCTPEDARAVVEAGATRFVAGDPTLAETLLAAEIGSARSILLLGTDDRVNLQVAMRARDLNPGIRIVMRQFNRALGRKIEMRLENTSVVSLAAQSAAIFAAATVDPANYYGVQFPDIDGPLFAFADRRARDLDIADRTLAAAQERLGCRILTVAGEIAEPGRTLHGDDRLVTFARITSRRDRGTRYKRRAPAIAAVFANLRGGWRRADPLARRLTISAAAFFACATTYFVFTLHTDPVTAAYFVLTTMTTTGYGDIVPHATDHFEQIAAMVTMLSGVILTGLFVALVAANFTQARYRAQQGMRRIDASGHIVVCGAGRVGSRVIDFLVALGRDLVVIERDPRPEIVERARNREFALFTGDATADATLAFCNLEHADAVVALTESDTMNLEVVLGAQAINDRLPVVMRVFDSEFAHAIDRHFHIGRTFGATDLVGPVLAALSFTAGARGYLQISGREYGVSQLQATEFEIARLAATDGIVFLAALRGGEPRLIDAIEQLKPGDVVLFLYPAYRYRKNAVTS